MPPTGQIHLTDTPTPSPSLLTLLTNHLPHSLPLLRRIQFAANHPGGSTTHTHVLYAHYGQEDAVEGERQGHFAAACVDLSRGPETQVWVYSTLEDGVNVAGWGGEWGGQGLVGKGSGSGSYSWAGKTKEEENALDLVVASFRRIWSIAGARSADADGEDEKGVGRILVGSLHETVRQGLLTRGVKMDKSAAVPPELEWEFCGKWLFRVESLPGASGALPEGMRWDRVRKEDVKTVRARSSINRQEATLLMLPSTVVRLDDGTPVAWAFMGLDGTIITLHVEEQYRRRGLAKALACKIMREHLPDYGDDGWGAADVFAGNQKSQALCRSIGGKNSWTLSWAVLDLSSVGDAM